MDRDSQIRAIEKTFEDTRKPIEKHYSKPNVVPVEIFSVFPDFKVLLIYLHTFGLSNASDFIYLSLLNFCSYGSTRVPKLFLILIQLLWVYQFLHKLKKCHKL